MSFRLKRKNIIIISPEPWGFVFVSKHHYAIELASKRNKVFFVNPPIKGMNGVSIKNTRYDGLYEVDYSVKIRGASFLPRLIRKFLNNRLVKKISRALNEDVEILINFENSRFYDLDIKGVKTIYFQVDQNQDFYPDRAAKSSNLVLAVNDEIKEMLEAFTKEVHKIPHAFHLPVSLAVEKKTTADYLTAGYVGNLDNYYINIDTFEEIISQNIHIYFKLIGPFNVDGEFYKRISIYKNVEFFGRVEWEDLANSMANIDLFLLVYNDDFRFSSHKVLEYLSTGKPIISSYLDEFLNHRDLVYMTSNKGLPELFRDIANKFEEASGDYYAQKRIDFSLNNTYEKRIEEIEHLLQEVR